MHIFTAMDSTAAVQTPPVRAEPAEVQSPPAGRERGWLRFALPTLGDLLFLAFFVPYALTPLSVGLLYDADVGWHIRNGDHILSTGAVPTADYFSYTRAGEPWYAWEWLYDILLSLVHSAAGLDGVVALSALIIALTFKLLYEAARARSGSTVIAMVLVLLAGLASAVHFHSRPHLTSWLFVLLYLLCLERFREGRPRALWWLPAVMLLWVNMHGGFVMGLVLLGIYCAGQGWTVLNATDPAVRLEAVQRLRSLLKAAAVVAAVTFLNPYGYKLHLHVWRYLRDGFLMDHIVEFASPDFHQLPARSFEVLLLVTLLAVALSPRARSATTLLLILMSAHISLYAVRNFPISSIILVLAVAPALGEALRRAGSNQDLAARPRRWLARLSDFSRRMTMVEDRLAGNLLPAAAVLVAFALLLNSGRALGAPLLRAGFDPQQMPVEAAEFIARQGITTELAAPDAWGGYLIYRLHPRLKLYIDDRHDFYGADYLREYQVLFGVTPGWRQVLNRYRIRWVLVEPDAPLAGVLREAPDWRVAHQDATAMVFARISAEVPASR